MLIPFLQRQVKYRPCATFIHALEMATCTVYTMAELPIHLEKVTERMRMPQRLFKALCEEVIK
jgi:hypothetical protein